MRTIAIVVGTILGAGVLGATGTVTAIALPGCGGASVGAGVTPPAPGAGVREGRLSLSDGGEIHYLEAGQGTAILLIHGTGGSANAWFDSFRLLAQSHRVVAYDRRGFGSSTSLKADGYLNRQTDDAAAVIDQLGLAPATVVGESWGGVVAMTLAANHPALVGRLVLAEPPYHAKANLTPDFAFTFLKVQVLRRLRGAECATRTFLRYAMQRTDGVNSFDRLPAGAQREILTSAPGSMVELDAGTGEELTEKRVAEIRVPVLLLQGSVSVPIFRKASDRIAGLLPQAHVQVISGSGHLIPFDQSAEFARAVLSIAG